MAAKARKRGITESEYRAYVREMARELAEQLANDVYDCSWAVLIEAIEDNTLVEEAADAARRAVRTVLMREG